MVVFSMDLFFSALSISQDLKSLVVFRSKKMKITPAVQKKGHTAVIHLFLGNDDSQGEVVFSFHLTSNFTKMLGHVGAIQSSAGFSKSNAAITIGSPRM